jgi:hypothetical protein
MRGIFMGKRCLSNILGYFFKFSLLPKKGGKKQEKIQKLFKKYFSLSLLPKR